MDLKALVEQLVALQRRFNQKQKAVIIVTMVTVVALISFLIVYNSPNAKGDDGFRLLYSELTPSDAGLIVAHLEKNKIEYQIPDDGSIEVSKEVVDKVRMDIAALGLPKESSVGFELFDTQEFGATDFDQNVKYMRALEGELSRTIAALSSIKTARVHIAIPKKSVFVKEQQAATASVSLSMAPNLQLGKKQVLGIKYLIASAVTKLSPDDVKIVDEQGMPLGEEDELSTAGEAAKMQLRYKKDYEKAYERKIVRMLAPFIGGRKKVVAKVTIEFDFSVRQSEQTVYDPNSVPRSEQTLEEKREGKKARDIGGVPGAVSNIGPVQGLQNNDTKEKYSKATATTNYEISNTISIIKGEFATIKRVTAAVVVDGIYEADEKSGELVFQRREPAEIEVISNLVRQTIGISNARNDEVTVTSFEFRVSPDEETQLTPMEEFFAQMEIYAGPLYPLFKYIFLSIVLFIFYKKIIQPFANKMLELEVEEEQKEDSYIAFEDEEYEDELERLNEMRKKVEQQLGLGGEADEESLRYDVILERLREMAEDKTEDMANIITQLMLEEVAKAEGASKKSSD
jgi:flagellar M-ring protein FliF